MNDTIDQIIQRVKNSSGITDPEQIEMIARTVTRSTELASMAALGSDVSEELSIVKATALNLSENVRNKVSEELLAFINQFVIAALTKALI